jgi:hypothetical protein
MGNVKIYSSTLLTTEEAAEILRTSPEALRVAARDGRVASVKILGRVLFPVDENGLPIRGDEDEK